MPSVPGEDCQSADSVHRGHLDRATAARKAVQACRRRSDREYFERFPLYVVPTYPGDARLFESEAFAAWLGDDLPIVRSTLEEVMELGDV